MTYGGSNQPRPSRNERREAAREKARLLREEQKKRERRNKILIQGGIIVAVVAIAALVGTLIFQSVKPEGPGPQNMASDGIVLTAGEDGGIVAVETPALAAGAAPTPTVPDDSGEVANIVDLRRLPLPLLRPVRGDELRVDAHHGRVGCRDPRGAPHRDPHEQVGRNAVLAARRQRGRVRGRRRRPTRSSTTTRSSSRTSPRRGRPASPNDELKSLAEEVGVSNQSTIEKCIDDVQFKAWVQDCHEPRADPADPEHQSRAAVGHRHADGARERPAVRRLARGPAGVPGVRAAGDERDVQRLRVAHPDAHADPGAVAVAPSDHEGPARAGPSCRR